MPEFKSIPELVMVGGRWELDSFQPSQPAWNFKSFEGKKGTIYVLRLFEYCKIGMSRDFTKRLASINCVMPFEADTVIAKKVPLAGMAVAEAWLHRKFREHAVKNEWFSMPSGPVLDALPTAMRLASVYDRYCRDWHLANKFENQPPHIQEKRRKDYERYLSARGLTETAEP